MISGVMASTLLSFYAYIIHIIEDIEDCGKISERHAFVTILPDVIVMIMD